MNDLLPIDSMNYKNKKQKWKDFGIWVAEKYEFDNLHIENAMIEIKVFSETRAKKDNDNISGGYKLLGDGLAVDSGMFIDDNYNHINPLLINCDYDKENPRTEIRISIFDNELKDVYKKLELHIQNWK